VDDEGWKAYDLTIEGVSYAKSFRSNVSAELERRGLDDVISRLEKNESAAGASKRG